MSSTYRTLLWNQLRGPDAVGIVVKHHQQGDLAAHDHLFHEVVFVEEGSGVHISAAGRTPLRPGHIVVLRPQVWHAYERTRDLRIINCLIDSRLIARFSNLLAQVPGTFNLYRRRTRQAQAETPTHLHASPAQSQAMLNRLNQAMEEGHHHQPGWQAMSILAVMEVLVGCARLSLSIPMNRPQASDPALDHTGRTPQAIHEVVAYLETHYHQSITLAKLAQHAHLSPGYLSRMFTRYMGMNIIAFIHRLRAEEACRLLKATRLPITDIAAQLGYEEIAYFSRCFRQQLGLSPKQYRQQDQRHED